MPFNPFSALTSKIFGGLSIVLILALGGTWLWGHHWKGVAQDWAQQAGQVVLALRTASDNPKADWKTAPGQIIALGESNRSLKVAIDDSNSRIDLMAEEAVRLRARADELQEIARKAEAQRRAAYAKLSDMAITPGTRDDCMQLLREAEAALDLVREAGL